MVAQMYEQRDNITELCYIHGVLGQEACPLWKIVLLLLPCDCDPFEIRSICRIMAWFQGRCKIMIKMGDMNSSKEVLKLKLVNFFLIR